MQSDGLEKGISGKWKPKESKIDFNSKAATRDKEDPYLTIKGPIHEEDIKVVNYMYLTLGHLNMLSEY